MKKFLMAVVVAGTVGGCAGTQPGGGGGISGVTPETIKQIQDASAQFCDFVPTARTIIAIFNAGQQIRDWATIAQTLCAAVRKVSIRRGGAVRMSVLVNGQRVAIKGRKIRR